MKKVLYLIIKISTSLLTIPFWFIKFFVGIGHMPNLDTGKIEEVRFYHSMYENIFDIDLGILFYISIIMMLSSVVLAIITTRVSNKRIKIISNVFFVITIVFLLICLLIASTVSRGY